MHSAADGTECAIPALPVITARVLNDNGGKQIHFGRDCERQAVLAKVRRVLVWIEFEPHDVLGLDK